MIDNKIINYLIIFLFIGMWGSIGSDPNNFLLIFQNGKLYNLNIFNFEIQPLINFSRAIFPLFCLVCTAAILIKYKLFYNQQKFIYILLIIQVIQIFTTLISNNSIIAAEENLINHLGRYHWLISSISLALILMIAKKVKNFDIQILFKISIFILSIIILWFSTKNIYDWFNLGYMSSIYHLNVWRDGASFLGHDMPRLTGLSRSILIIYIVILFTLNNSNKFFKYPLLMILGSLVILFQSKYAIITFLIIHLFYLLSLKNKIKNLIIISLLICSQFIIFYSTSNLRILFSKENISTKKENILTKNENILTKNENTEKNNENIEHFRFYRKYNEDGDFKIETNIFSGRIDIWRNSLEYIKKRPFLGYGSMSDRMLLNKKENINTAKKDYITHPASNSFIYSAFSGGIFCTVFLIYFLFNIRKKILNIFFLNKTNKTEEKIGTIIIFVILLRSLIENSYMLYGIDYILLLNSLYLINKK